MTNGEALPPKKDNTVMLVLSYIWLLALVPLLVEKDDPEVQWHAKHGLVLLAAEIILWVAFGVCSAVLHKIPGVGCVVGAVGCMIPSIISIGFIALRVMCIIKATKGERMMIPYISEYASKF
jgi:uncharacterized membrane protein